MRHSIMEIEGHKWHGDMASWVNGDGNPVSNEENIRLSGLAKEESRRRIIQRLADAETIFNSMSGTVERKAAHCWLKEYFDL